jgi:hypothetical protein
MTLRKGEDSWNLKEAPDRTVWRISFAKGNGRVVRQCDDDDDDDGRRGWTDKSSLTCSVSRSPGGIPRQQVNPITVIFAARPHEPQL